MKKGFLDGLFEVEIKEKPNGLCPEGVPGNPFGVSPAGFGEPGGKMI